jgi:SMODS and SLOG-associating 2TM effector domain 1
VSEKLTAQAEAGASQGTLADEKAEHDAWPQGRISLHLRVGVTGHRSLDEDDHALGKRVRHALYLIKSRCREGRDTTPISLTVVSALAEGADRIVAREAIKCGASFEVVLPLPLDDYLTDFESAKSRSEFRTLLDRASAITELGPAGGRDEAYERAGRAIVDRSDVLLALWDGQSARGRGGTEEIVSYAQRERVPVRQVPVERVDPGSPHPRRVHETKLPECFGLLSNEAFKQLDRFNQSVRTGCRDTVFPLLLPDLATPVPSHVQTFVNYAQPYYNRAEQVAQSSQRVFIRLTRLLYSLAAAAVILVATQVIFFGHDPQIVWAEVAALATVVVTLILGRRARWHERWLAARYLAERIRCGVFLAAVGGGDDLRTAVGQRQAADCDQPDPGRKRLERAAAALRLWVQDRWVAARHWVARSRARRVRAAAFPDGGEDDFRSAAGQTHTADSVRPDPNREWAERAFLEIYWRAQNPPAHESELPVLRLLIEAWIYDQWKYHKRVSKRLARRQRLLSWLAVVLFGVSAVVALFHSLNVLESASEPDVWGYFSVVIPAVGAAISGYSAQREYDRLAERSRLMAIRLEGTWRQVNNSQELSSLRHAVRRTELLMRSETADWYEVVRLHDFELPA